MGNLILKFAERHPVIFSMMISAVVMRIVNDEALSLGICTIWGIVGLAYGVKAIDAEGNKW